MGSKHERAASAWRGSPQIKSSPGSLANMHQEKEPLSTNKLQGLTNVWASTVHFREPASGDRQGSHCCAGDTAMSKELHCNGMANRHVTVHMGPAAVFPMESELLEGKVTEFLFSLM